MESIRSYPYRTDCPGPLQPGFRPFDPLKLTESLERRVCLGDRRLYSRFGSTINYRTGIATGYAVGCPLRCVFCWSGTSRDNPEGAFEYYAPSEVFERLETIAAEKRLDQVRISDCEATIGKMHLLGLLDLVERSSFRRFILETNGIRLGHDREYVKDLVGFKKLIVRVSIKAGTPDEFTRKTGAVPDAFELPFRAAANLRESGVPFWVAAMSADPRFMSPGERVSLLARLARIHPDLVLHLEEEVAVLYPDTLKRLRAAGWNLACARSFWIQGIPWLGRRLQVSYVPVSALGRRKMSIGYTVKAIRELFHGT
jgi:uncharacterized Fe-S cluster-containing radical SAM superfamily protein